MEKIKVVIDFDTVYPNHRYPQEEVYRASDIDALLSDVRALVAIAKTVDPVIDMLNSARTDARTATEILMTWQNVFSVVSNLEKAIAAVERHLEKSA